MAKLTVESAQEYYLDDGNDVATRLNEGLSQGWVQSGVHTKQGKPRAAHLLYVMVEDWGRVRTRCGALWVLADIVSATNELEGTRFCKRCQEECAGDI